MQKTLVFGASLKSNRHSHHAMLNLKANGFEILGFGPQSGEINGIRIFNQIPESQDFHTITMYMNSDRQKMFYDMIIDLSPQRVIFNPGTENPEFYQLLKDSGILYEEACTLTLLATGQY